MKTIELAGKTCEIHEHLSQDHEQECAVVLIGSAAHQQPFNPQIFQVVDDRCASESYVLVTYEVTDWDNDLTPWPYEGGPHQESFEGHGPETLTWIEQHLVPAMRDMLAGYPGKVTFYLAGYSLAGLFSLWSFYESSLFHGVASCSGSLWYPGWIEYLEQAAAPENSVVYLSLGTKEYRLKNKLMARISERTELSEHMISRDPHVSRITFEWNNGGHFTDPAKRLAKGIAWLIENGVIKEG